MREPQLVQRQPHMDLHRKRTGNDLQIQLTPITNRDLIKPVPPIHNDAGEHIQPAGRTFWVRQAIQARRQGQLFHQGNQINGVFFQYPAIRNIKIVKTDLLELRFHRFIFRKETALDPESLRSQAQIQAHGLNLGGIDRLPGLDHPLTVHLLNQLAGKIS